MELPISQLALQPQNTLRAREDPFLASGITHISLCSCSSLVVHVLVTVPGEKVELAPFLLFKGPSPLPEGKNRVGVEYQVIGLGNG